MDLLGKMVGAPGPSAAALAETKTDAELIEEIAPAMLIRLREDGKARGAHVAGTLLMAWLLFSHFYWDEVRLDPTQYSTTTSDLYLWAILPLGLIMICAHFYFKRRSVLTEVRYRRHHGKWRWER
jgi:hypothetical protein